MQNTIATFWAGRPLQAIEQLSALSFLATGHRLIIYTTDELSGVPDGVEVRDARDILKTTHLLTYKKTGSPALHADLFRYALQKKTNYIWSDLDIIALKPLPFDRPYLFGYENSKQINQAVLRLPPESPALHELAKFNENTRGYPPSITGLRLLKYKLKSFGRGLPIADWPWGSTGPRALTHYLHMTGEIVHALPPECFYPIPYTDCERFLTPDDLTLESFASSTFAIHLWGKELQHIISTRYNGKIPKRSFLDMATSHYSERHKTKMNPRIEK